jgi:tRNA(Ile)-lysidine synthase
MLAKSAQYAHNSTMALPHSDLANSTAETLTKYQMLEAKDRVLVGVSGGADSVSLVLVLKELGYETGIGHLNHGLRGLDSDGDEHFVSELASKLGVPFYSQRISIRTEDGNLEAAGREARKAFFRSVSEQHGFTKIAVAHTRDDRVETCLLHLLRGAGLEGMVSMAPVSGNTIRPLIETSHEKVQHFLLSSNRSWRNDASNLDPAFARNRMRREVIPMLEESFNPNLRETLSRTIELLHNEDAWMQELTANWVSQHAVHSQGIVSVDAETMRGVPVALARRAIRTMLKQAGSDLFDITFDRIEAIRGLLDSGKSGKSIQIPGRFVAERAFDRIVFRQIHDEAKEFDYVLPIPGTVHIPELGRTFRAGIADGTMVPHASDSNERVFVDGGSLGACVKIRSWKPGDYYKPVGWPGGKLKKFFQQTRIPRSQRSRWPVIVSDSTVVWVASFPVSREFAPSGRSQKIVTLEVL